MDRAGHDHWRARDVARLLALLENERRYYQEILASIPVGAAVVSRDGRVTTANRAFRRALELRAEDLRRVELRHILPSPELDAAIEGALTAGASHPGVPVHAAGRALRIAVTRLRATSEDGDREALLTLQEAGPPFAIAALPNLPDVPALIWKLDPVTLQFQTVEGPGEHLLGYSREHWLSTPDLWINRVHPADRRAVEDFYRAAIVKGGDFGCEFRVVGYNGASEWRRDIFTVVLDETGHARRICGITIDAGARRQAEMDHAQASRVDAISGLARQLSHELNNSLMIVAGYAEELLAELAEDDRRRADVKAILGAAETMAGLAGELHGFTRAQASPPSRFNIATTLTSVAARIRGELGATLVLRLAGDALFAHADPVQLEAVLLSIARRLRDKIDPHMVLLGAVRSIAELSGLDLAFSPGEYVEIVVRGPFACEVPASAFETFLSGKDPHGSDMARAYAIVREWGGTIFTHRAEHISEVHVLLRAATPDAPERPAPPPAEAVTQQSGGAVLVVEDENGIRSLVRKILEREGYTVLESASAEEAIELARRGDAGIRLLIADLKLPGIGGRELADKISGIYPDLRVLYISGYTDDAAGLARDVGAGAGFLQKPFTLASLLKKVRDAFEG